MSTTVHIKRNEIATNRSKGKNETWVSTRRYAWVYVRLYLHVCVCVWGRVKRSVNG